MLGTSTVARGSLRMELFALLKFLHIGALFFAVALAISGEIVVRRVAASRDVRSIRTVVERVRPLAGTGANIFFLAGIAFGFLAAITGQFDLLRPWLILAYLAVAAAFVIGGTIIDPWVERLGRTAAASAEDRPSDDLLQVIGDPRARYGSVALMVLITFLIFDMVVKPLG